MASNALSGRPFFPRPPVVCVEGPIDPGFNLTCLIWLDALQIRTGRTCQLWWFGSNTLRLKGEPVVSVWDPGLFGWREPPATNNRVEAQTTVFAPHYPGLARITVTSTWEDGTVMFAFVEIPVYEPM